MSTSDLDTHREGLLDTFGLRVRELRQAEGLSQHELAARTGLNRSYISGIERGDRNVSLENIAKLAEGLDVPIGALFELPPAAVEKLKGRTDPDASSMLRLFSVSAAVSAAAILGGLPGIIGAAAGFGAMRGLNLDILRRLSAGTDATDDTP